MSIEEVKAFRQVHSGQTVDLVKFESDLNLNEQECKNIVPEDKKHMVFSVLTAESIMILKRLISYCDQKSIDVEYFIS